MDAVQDLQPTLQELDERVVVNLPSFNVRDDDEDPAPTPTPFPDDDEQIPVTGGEDSSDEPIIQINWDALGDSLRKFWENLKEVEIDLTPNDNR